MTNVAETDVCKTCGRARRGVQTAGSLTQWLFNPDACDCDFVKLAREFEGQEKSNVDELCFTCGKRVAHGRKGSLTQWVFRADTCSCARASLIPAETDSSTGVPEVVSDEHQQPSGYPSVYEEPDEELTATIGLPADRYGAIKILGRGAFTKVYKCWDKSLNKPVAVKHLSGLNLSAAEVIQFQDEAKATSTLSHPDIVRVLDFGATDGGHPYMVMEFIDGESLDVLIAQHGPMPSRIVALLTMSICAGMQHAHNQGIYHRDIKSSNIMIPLAGTGVIVSKIIDFGIAAIHRGDKEGIRFQGHLLAGTPGYMSPDQLRGEPFDQRSDIYSLGCTMFEALTGRVPFVGNTPMETLSQHASMEPPKLQDVNRGIDFPETIEKIVAKTLCKRKEDRYQSMLELKHALEEFLEESQTALNDAKAASAAEDDAAGEGLFGLSVEAVKTEVTSKSKGKNYILYGALATTVICGAVFICHPLVKPPDEKEKQEPLNTPAPTAPPESMSDFTRGLFHLQSTGLNDETLKNWPKDKLEVDLVASDVTDKGLTYIADLPLTGLRVDACKITDKGLETIGKIRTLHTLYVGDNPDLTADGIKQLSGLQKLEQLSVNATQLDDSCLPYIAQLKNLKYLSLGSLQMMDGKGLIHLKDMPRLISVKISGVNLSKDGIKSLSQLKNITRLEARKVNLTEDCLNAICSLKNLEMLNLSETRLDDEGLAKLSKLKKLRVLRIELCPLLTRQGLARFQAKLPQCSISDGRSF